MTGKERTQAEMEDYRQRFYANRHSRTVYSAETVLDRLFTLVPGIRSVVDVGCGVGTWLHVSLNKGVKDILGIDGPWVNRGLLVIPEECFLVRDLSDEIILPKRYDLAISLEVAEHIPAAQVHTYARSLVSLSDTVLFSAAIPCQGGRNHVNEQWPEYCYSLFQGYGYDCLDVFRMAIWNDEGIRPWYRQNLLLFMQKDRLRERGLEVYVAGNPPPALVHPGIFIPKMEPTLTVKGTWKLLWKAMKRTLRARMR